MVVHRATTIAFFEKGLGQIHFLVALVALLIEVDSPHPVLRVLEIGRDVDDIVITAHVAEESHEAAFIELHELLGNPYRICLGTFEVFADEGVARHSGDVLFNESVPVDEIVDPVRGEDVFEFEAVNARRIGDLHVEVVVVVVELVHDPDPERPRIPEIAEVDPV